MWPRRLEATGTERGGREQDANSAKKDQCGGTPEQGNEARPAGKGAAQCQANGPPGRIQRGYGRTRVKGPFLTLLNNSKALIKMFNAI